NRVYRLKKIRFALLRSCVKQILSELLQVNSKLIWPDSTPPLYVGESLASASELVSADIILPISWSPRKTRSHQHTTRSFWFISL
ncbi:mCG145628, partial [Mus musculus]